jgi:hypothetical protein
MKKPMIPTISIILVIALFIGCGQNKTEKNVEDKVLKKDEGYQIKKKNKTAKPKNKTLVSVDVMIDGKKFALNDKTPKYNSDVVFTREGMDINYDLDELVVLAGLYAPEVFISTPVTFTQQLSALSPEEQLTSTKRRSRIRIRIPGSPERQGDAKLFYKGNVILEKFTDNEIVVNFDGQGFANGKNPKNGKNLFPMSGSIVVKNFNVYDSRK